MIVVIKYWPLGILSFALSYLVHLVIWNRFQIRKHILCLVGVFSVPVIPFFFTLYWVGGDFTWLVAPMLTHAILVGNYLAIYPAFQASSPTIHILNYLWRARKGVEESSLLLKFVDSSLVENRKEDLIKSKLVVRENNGLALSIKGRWLADLFFYYRKALRLERGKG